MGQLARDCPNKSSEQQGQQGAHGRAGSTRYNARRDTEGCESFARMPQDLIRHKGQVLTGNDQEYLGSLPPQLIQYVEEKEPSCGD